MKEIIFYRTDSGNCPVIEFLDSLTGKQAQKVVWVLQLIEELDNVSIKYFKKLVNTNDIWEVRIQLGNNIFRILGFKQKPNKIILNHGFQKKTQKTPDKDIKISESRKNDYLKQGQNNE